MKTCVTRTFAFKNDSRQPHNADKCRETGISSKVRYTCIRKKERTSIEYRMLLEHLLWANPSAED